ncbi:MAG: HAMP domain-containing sensor histidine kinase [Bdellovibrionia bacterium]
MKIFGKRERAMALLIAFNLVFAAGVLTLPRGSWIFYFWEDTFHTFASLYCALELLRVSRKCHENREKLAWFWFSGGCFLYSLGMLIWSWVGLVQGDHAIKARFTDVYFIGMALCFLVGIIYLRLARPQKGQAWVFVSEFGITLCLIFLLGGTLLYHPIQEFTGDPLYLAFILARAVCHSSTALFAVISISQRPALVHPRVASLLIAGIVTFAGAYMAYAYVNVTHLYKMGELMDVIWNVAFSFLFLAGFEQNQLAPEGGPLTPWKDEQSQSKPPSMAWLWGILLVSLGVGIAPFWATLSDNIQFLLATLVFLIFFVSIRWELLLLEEKRARMELLKALRLREDFLAIAAHELRTPLTPLKIQISLLRKFIQSPKPEQLKRLSGMILSAEQQLDRLQRLVEDLLDVSKIEEGSLTLKREELDLEKLVREVVEQLRYLLRQANCELSLKEENPVRGSWDRLRIEQVVTNLLLNAIKYGAGKVIEVVISKRDDRARLTIRDYGIGIAREDQQKVFEKFERAVPVTAYGGLGLGLFIAQQIVKSHGGTIQLESEPERGALFIVELPLQAHPEN